MNTKALYAVMLAILLPTASYLVVKHFSESALIMPPHYFPDSVIVSTKKGKQVTDTVWHQLGDFSLTNQLGQKVSWNDLNGKIVIADFFFTHCPTICPFLTKNMKRLQESITNSEKIGDRTNKYIHFLSFSIDPDRDSVERLKYWANRFQIDPDQWWLLTGNKKKIYDLIINEMKIPVEDGQGVDTSFMHTDHFVLIDSNRYVRGFYHGLDSTSLAKLSNDIVLLTLEKGPKEKGVFAGKTTLVLIVLAITAVSLVLFLYQFRKKNL